MKGWQLSFLACVAWGSAACTINPVEEDSEHPSRAADDEDSAVDADAKPDASPDGGAASGVSTLPTELVLPTCENEQPLPDLARDATLSSGKCYTVSGAARVSGATLTIEPGVVLKFKQNASLMIQEEGAISALGSALAPITFMGSIAEIGHWESLIISSDNPRNELAFVQFAHGGSTVACCRSGRAGAMLIVTDQSRVSIRDSLFALSGLRAIEFEAGSEVRQFERNRFLGNRGAPVRLAADQVAALDAASDYAGPSDKPNRDAFIEISQVDVNEDAVWPATNLPYRARSGLSVSASLTLAPGVVVEFEDRQGMDVHGGGSLHAVGSADQRITLRGTQKGAGRWLGLAFSGSSAPNQLGFVDLDGAGSGTWCCTTERNVAGAAGVLVESGAQLDIQDSVLSGSGHYGLRALDKSVMQPFARNSFRMNASAGIAIQTGQVPMLDAGSTFKGDNGEDRVVVLGGSGGSGTWQKLDVPYRIAGTATLDGAVVIAPGTSLLFEPNAGLWVGSKGSLSAVTSTRDITFKAVTDSAAGWLGIGIGSVTPQNVLDGVTIDGGGAAVWCCVSGRAPANVLVEGTATIKNSQILRSGGWGIFKVGSMAAVTQSDNSFAGNRSGDASP